MHTYIYHQFETSPILSITSPEKRSGKTRLLEVIEMLVVKPLRTTLPSDAVLYRLIEQSHPVLIIDEADAVFSMRAASKQEGLRAILNAGNRPGTKVPRVVGPDMEIRFFDVFTPKALAGIGRLPDTVEDRSIMIRLRRRTQDEVVERFRTREQSPLTLELRDRLESAMSGVNVQHCYPALPPELNDRAADCWEPLLAIADAAGGVWPSAAREAAKALAVRQEGDDDGLARVLLGDLKRIFGRRADQVLWTRELLAELTEILRTASMPTTPAPSH